MTLGSTETTMEESKFWSRILTPSWDQNMTPRITLIPIEIFLYYFLSMFDIQRSLIWTLLWVQILTLFFGKQLTPRVNFDLYNRHTNWLNRHDSLSRKAGLRLDKDSAGSSSSLKYCRRRGSNHCPLAWKLGTLPLDQLDLFNWHL
jgi:hypothetical protein